MKKKYGPGYRRRPGARDFEPHRRERGSGDVRRGAAWRFRKLGLDFLEPHYRVTSRMAALPGKHVRQVQEPARPSHCK